MLLYTLTFFLQFFVYQNAADTAIFSLMVTNPTVIQQVRQIEQNLTETNAEFVKFVQNVSSLHVRLNKIEFDAHDLPIIQKFISELPKALCNISSQVPVIFSGTGIKANKTLFGKMNTMSSQVIVNVHQAIYRKLNETGITSLDELEIFHSKMEIVELDDGKKHDALLKIMTNKTGDFKLNTGDFVKEIHIWNSTTNPSSPDFSRLIGKIALTPCQNFTKIWKPELITNRINVPLNLDFL